MCEGKIINFDGFSMKINYKKKIKMIVKKCYSEGSLCIYVMSWK